MARFDRRIEKLEDATGMRREVVVNVMPGQTLKAALAAFKRAHGPFDQRRVVYACHSFTSGI